MNCSPVQTNYEQTPPTGWALSIEESHDVSVYGTGLYNWFHGNQTVSLLSIAPTVANFAHPKLPTYSTQRRFDVSMQAVFQLVNSKMGMNLYGLNTYGCTTVVVGDVTVPADATTKTWFTHSVIALDVV